MADARPTALVVCPGRGTYGKAELGYLARHHADQADLLATFDALRAGRGQPTVSELDAAERYTPSLYARGDIASPLIYACSIADFRAIDRDRHELVAIAGNSMGWYTALACGGALSAERGFQAIDAMGDNSQAGEPGGQVLLTLVDADWRPVPGLREQVGELVDAIAARDGCSLYISIPLGGMLVVAGNETGLAALLAEAPPTPGRDPMRLLGHGPFHTPLMQASSARALATLPAQWFGGPDLPLIDGRGHIWRPLASAPAKLHRYTFFDQILRPYDFTRAVEVAMKEYAPDRIILLGPGETLGGAIAQALIGIGWDGLASKADFQERQAADPILMAMGREGQRAAVVRS